MGSPAIFKGKLVKFLAKAGILVPSRGEADRTTEPAAGETAFNTDSNSLEVYNGSSWGSVEAPTSELKKDTEQLADSLIFVYENTVRNYSTYYRTLVTDSGDSAFFYGEFQAYCKKSELKLWSAVEVNASDAEISSYKFKLVDGVINCSIIIGNNIYIQGDFKRYGDVEVNGFAKISLITGDLDPVFNCGEGFNGIVNEFAVDSSGFLYAVGGFYSYQNYGVYYICKLDPNTGDIVLPFSEYTNTYASSTIKSIVIDSSDNIYIGGLFTTYNNVSTNRIVKINSTDGARDPTFNMGTGFNSDVNTLALDDEGNLYCGGNFTSYNGTSLNRIAKLNAVTGALDTTFTIGSGFNSAVYDIIVSDNQRIFVAGNFTSYNGQSLSRLVKLNTNDATLDATFSTSITISGSVNGILADGIDSIYLYGTFTNVNSVAAKFMVKLNATTGANDTVFDTSDGFSSAVKHVSIYNDKLCVFGAFANYKNVNPLVAANNCVKLKLPSLTPDPNFTSTILFSSKVRRMIANSANAVYACGDFFYYNDEYRPRLVKFNETTGAIDTAFFPSDFNSIIEDLHLHGADSLFCGGSFTTYDSQIANRILKISASTGVRDSTFTSGTGFDGTVLTMISDGDDLYVGGYFTDYNGTSARSIVKINAITGAINTTFDSATKGPSLYANVYGMILDNDTGLYVYGYFYQYNGINCGGHFKVNRVTNDTDSTFVLNIFTLFGSIYTTIRSAVTDGTHVYVTGKFDKYGITQRNGLVKFNLTTGAIDTTFDPAIGVYPLNTYNDNQQISLVPNSNLLLYSGDEYLAYKGSFSTALIDRNTANIPVTTIPMDSFEVSLVEHNRVYYINTNTNLFIYIPTNLPIGYKFKLVQLGSGELIVIGRTGVTVNSSDGLNSTGNQYNAIDVVSYAADKYIVTKG
jgi:hypothetical protein